MKTRLLNLALPLVLTGGCSGTTTIGTDCAYTTTNGVCTITQVGTSTTATVSQLGANETKFTFTAEGATSSSDSGELTTGVDDLNPSAACLSANHIAIGAALPCTLQVETRGACTPKIFTVTGFNHAAAGCP
jgi:hypothetical protein